MSESGASTPGQLYRRKRFRVVISGFLAGLFLAAVVCSVVLFSRQREPTARAETIAPHSAAEPALDVREKWEGATPLMQAVKGGNRDLAMLLLHAGADPNIRSTWGCGLPLHCAGRGGDAGLVRALLEHGADPDLLDSTGLTALHNAAVKSDRDILNLLIAAGADLEARTKQEDWTPMMVAVYNAHPEGVDILVRAGADANASISPSDALAVFAPGSTALDIARALSQPELEEPPSEEFRSTLIRNGGIEAWRKWEEERQRVNAKELEEAQLCHGIVLILEAHGARTAQDIATGSGSGASAIAGGGSDR